MVMKSIVPVVMTGVLGIYGLIIVVTISIRINSSAKSYYLFDVYAHLSFGLAGLFADPAKYKRSRLARTCGTVNRPYGGVLSGAIVRERIIRAFLVEEQKIVKNVLKIQKAKEKQA